MSISAISASNSYSSMNGIGAQANIEQLKLDEQKLQKELQQLKVKSSGKSNQTKEKTLEQEISTIEQKIQQAGNGSTTSNAQSSQSQDSPAQNEGSSELNQLA